MAAVWDRVQGVGLLVVEVSHRAVAPKLDALALQADCFVGTGNEEGERFGDTRTLLALGLGAYVVVFLALEIPRALPILAPDPQ